MKKNIFAGTLGVIVALVFGLVYLADNDSVMVVSNVENESKGEDTPVVIEMSETQPEMADNEEKDTEIEVAVVDQRPLFGFADNLTPIPYRPVTQSSLPTAPAPAAPLVAGLTTSAQGTSLQTEGESEVQTNQSLFKRPRRTNENRSSIQKSDEISSSTASSSPNTAATSTNSGTGTSTPTTGGGTPPPVVNPPITTPTTTFTLNEEVVKELQNGNACNPESVLPLNEAPLHFLPVESLFSKLNASGTVTTEAGYRVHDCGEVVLAIKTVASVPVEVLLLIKGSITPSDVSFWSQLDGSTLTDTIIYAVASPFGGRNLLASQFPTAFQAAITNTYGGKITLKPGIHATAGVTVRGLLGDAVSTMGYPTSNLTMTAGSAMPPATVSTGIGAAVGATKSDTSLADGLKPTNYIELHHGASWQNAAGVQGLTLDDTTVYYDDGNNFGFWGVGAFTGTPVVAAYNGPLAASSDPRDYLSAEFGFGSARMSVEKALLFGAAYQGRYPYLAGGATGVTAPAEYSFTALTTALEAVPIEVLSVTNPALHSLQFTAGGEFPGLQYFTAAVLGPLATNRAGESGAEFRLQGNAELFQAPFGELIFRATPVQATGTASGNFAVDLGSVNGQSFGSLGGEAQLTLAVSTTSQSMQLDSTLQAGPFGGQGLTLNFSNSQINFYRAAECVFPLNVTGYAVLSNPGSMTISDLVFIPSATIPDPTALLNCPEDIYFMMKEGVVIAFNGTVQLLEFGNSFLPENDVTRLGIDGFKFAGGALIAAPEEMAALVREVPGVSESIAAAEDAARLAREAAQRAVQEAAEAAAQAAAAAAAAAQAAMNQSLTLVTNFVSDPVGAVGNIASAVGDAVADITGFGDSSSIPGFGWKEWTNGQVYAKDVSVSHGSSDWVWLVDDSGNPLQFERGAPGYGYFWNRRNGLPLTVQLARIDADAEGGAVAVSTAGEIYVTGRTVDWKKANGYATDVAVGGGYIWTISTQPDGGGYRIYRAPYATNRTEFHWEDMQGSGIRIDVGSDGDAWTSNNHYKMYEHTDGWWRDRHGFGLDVAVSNSNRAWIIGLNYNAGAGGGQIHAYEESRYEPLINATLDAYWAQTDGYGTSIGAGHGRMVWVTNHYNRIYEGTGRE